MEIREVISPKGVRAWLVEDHALPIFSVNFAFRGGSTQDPAGREGLATLMSGLFDEGAGTLDREAFGAGLDETGAQMRFSASRDAFYGSLRVTTDSRDAALDLLREAVNRPRFDAEPFERIRAQLLSGVQARANDPQALAGRKWLEALYGDHPYAREDNGTAQSLSAMTAEELHRFHKQQFARSNLVIGVVGDISPEALAEALDRVFGDLPAEAQLTPVPDVTPVLAQEVRFDYDLPQATLQFAYPGVKRDDPRFFAGVLMNQVLGGDDTGSRLFDEVREKRGLAYGVGSSLVSYDHAQALVISTATQAPRATETLNVIRETVRSMADKGPSEAELDAAKRYLIGAYAINNLSSSAAIAGTLVMLQLENLPIDYIDRRTSLIEGVSVEDTRTVARELLLAEPAVLVIGPNLTRTVTP
ncbi:MAG: peptidase M16 [Mesorhizobium amorphae]|nr:MAG: peptidase M16 [Mesorhizobium amorphae]